MISSENLPQSTNLKEKHFNFLQDKIYCSQHQKEAAKSYCADCSVFCCMAENCGQPHIYHNMENFDYLINNQVLPMVKTLLEVNKLHDSNFQFQMTNINTFKNNLRNFAINEKRKIDDSYKQLTQVITEIYSIYMQDINELIESLNLRFDKVHEKIESLGKNNQTGN